MPHSSEEYVFRLLEVINKAKRKLDRKAYSHLTCEILPALIERSSELREALSELPYVVSRASLTSVHRIISLTKIALALYLQEVLPRAAENKILYHRTQSRRRSVDRMFNQAKEMEKRNSIMDWTPRKRSTTDESSHAPLESPPGRIKPYRGSMVTLKQDDSDAHIIPEIVHILTGQLTPEKKSMFSSRSSSGVSKDEKDNDDRGAWTEALNSRGQRYFYNWKSKRMTFSDPHSPEYRSGNGMGGPGGGYRNVGGFGFGDGSGNGTIGGDGTTGSGGGRGRSKRGSWEIRMSEDGKKYYYNAARRRASWIHPDDIMSQVSTSLTDSPTSSMTNRSSMFSVPTPENASKRIFLSDTPELSGGDGNRSGGLGEGGYVEDTVVKTVVKDSLNVQIHVLESEKAKWELNKREMENQIESLKNAVSRRDSDLQKELLHVAELEHELDIERHGGQSGTSGENRRTSQRVADVITKLEEGVADADQKCENIGDAVTKLKTQRMSVMTGTAVPSTRATLPQNVELQKLRRRSLDMVRRTRAMTMPTSDLIEAAKKRGGFENKSSGGGGFNGEGGSGVNGNNMMLNKVRIHIAGISGGQEGETKVDGRIAKVQTKKGIRSRVVALDGWQLWELVYGKAFVMDTLLQLRDEYRAKKRVMEKTAQADGQVSRLRTRSSAIPCPYPPVEECANSPEKNSMVKFWWKPLRAYKLKDTIWEQIGWNVSKLVDPKHLYENFRKGAVAHPHAGKNTHLRRKKHHRGHLGSIETKMWVPYRRMKMTLDDLRKIMGDNEARRVDLSEPDGLTIENVRMLMDLLPNDDVLNRIGSVQPEELTEMESFILGMCESVPNVERRLKSLQIYWTFQENVASHENKVMRQYEAIRCIQSSKSLVNIMGMIRTIGNYLNYGSQLGSQHAFELKSLEAICQVKMTTNKSRDMMDFIISELAKSSPETLRLPEELSYLDNARHVNSENELTSASRKLHAEVRIVASLYEELERDCDNPLNEAFCNVFEDWIKKAKAALENIDAVQDELKTRIANVLKSFGPEAVSGGVKVFLTTLRAFRNNFRNARENFLARERRMNRGTQVTKYE